MKNSTFYLFLSAALLITLGSIIYITETVKISPESLQEGYTQPVQYIELEVMEIHVPVTELDFTDEEPMVITP